MSPKTQKALDEMVAWAREGNDVIPMFFSECNHGRAAVSAAIRVAKKRGLLIEDRKDGCGNPLYRAPVPAATHAGSAAIN